MMEYRQFDYDNQKYLLWTPDDRKILWHGVSTVRRGWWLNQIRPDREVVFCHGEARFYLRSGYRTMALYADQKHHEVYLDANGKQFVTGVPLEGQLLFDRMIERFNKAKFGDHVRSSKVRL